MGTCGNRRSKIVHTAPKLKRSPFSVSSVPEHKIVMLDAIGAEVWENVTVNVVLKI